MRRYIALPLLALVCLGGVFFLNHLMVDVQWEEMEHLLTQRSGEEAALESASLWGRLELVKNRLRYGETPVENYVLEARIQALNTAFDNPQTRNSDSWKTQLVNFFRKLMGREALVNGAKDDVFQSIEEAYLYEKTRKFSKAAEVYQKLISANPEIPQTLLQRIRLHLGFCLALYGDRELALKEFSLVIALNAQNDAARLAAVLEDFLKKLGEIQRNTQSQTPNANQVRDSYYSMDYLKSLNYFNTLKIQDDAQARYFKGRSHEELGQLDLAQSEYRRVIFLDPDGEWGKESRRRLVMQDKVYAHKSELSVAAAKELIASGDGLFVKSLENYPGAALLSSQSPLPKPLPMELYVYTQPAGAQVSLNGVLVGTSPLFVTDVPSGKLKVEGRIGGRTASKTLEIDEQSITRVNLDLSIKMGRLAVKSAHSIASVYLNEQELKNLDNILPGDYNVLIQARKSNGEVILWEQKVSIPEGGTAVIEVP